MFYEIAFISALFHDMSYPWQYVNGLSKNLKDSNYGEINGALLSVGEAVKKMNESLPVYPFYGYHEATVKNPSQEQEAETLEMIKKGLLNKHGLPRAVGFMCLNEKIRCNPRKTYRKRLLSS